MRAGSGIEHAEGGGNPPHINKHGFQLWINLPSTKKMDQPAYGTVQPEAVPERRSSGGGMSRFVAGKGSLALNDRDDFEQGHSQLDCVSTLPDVPMLERTVSQLQLCATTGGLEARRMSSRS